MMPNMKILGQKMKESRVTSKYCRTNGWTGPIFFKKCGYNNARGTLVLGDFLELKSMRGPRKFSQRGSNSDNFFVMGERIQIQMMH